MAQYQRRIGLFGALLIAAGSALAWAGEPPMEDATAWQNFWDSFHNPSPRLNMGLDFRFRSVWGENMLNLNETGKLSEYEYQRYRTRWWTKWLLNDDVSFNTRLTWEFRTWDEPVDARREFDADEAVFDNFNIGLKNIGGMPLSATIGRQDMLMVFGVGWLIMDGTPGDGSRTFYFDAARFTYAWPGDETKLDVVYIDQSAESDRWLQPICDEDRAVALEDERGLIFYLTNKSFEGLQLEGYFIYKNDNPPNGPLTGLVPSWSRKADICTFGAAVAGSRGDHWKYRAEGAFQTGEKSEATPDLSTGTMQDLEAYGALTNLEYLFKDPLDNSLHTGLEYASGDDPGTDDIEHFDLLWGQWPRWSELYAIYTYFFETSPGDSTNLIRLNIGHKFRPIEKLQVATDYHALWADENSGAVIPSQLRLSNSDKFRGHLFTLWLKYTHSKQWRGHVVAEYFKPGDYYLGVNDERAFFIRFNIEHTF